jgi:type III restriction enzyme
MIGVNFPNSPYEIIHPDDRWSPVRSLNLFGTSDALPPLVKDLRVRVFNWRNEGYPGASSTSINLLNYWFNNNKKTDGNDYDFQYYFAQREAIETIIYLYETENARQPYDLIKYDSSGLVSKKHFDENWTRYVCKLATGAGKTKLLSLVIAWSYFNKQYEVNSDLTANFILLTPNIIVLDRLTSDFENLKIFTNDPIIPPNGYANLDWQNDFDLSFHKQNQINNIEGKGNLFITNIQRIYRPKDKSDSFSLEKDSSEYFLGKKPKLTLLENKTELIDVVTSLEDLMILNDEAHHIHDKDLAWFETIKYLDNMIKDKTGKGIKLQVDVTATPKKSDGSIFVQTVSSYPLVEAIRQQVVKSPVVPDIASRAILREIESNDFATRYSDHIKLGYEEWQKYKTKFNPVGEKAILFIMTPDTSDADSVKSFIEVNYPDLVNKILLIHTNSTGDIEESKSKTLDDLRKSSSEIDRLESPYECVISVLMLKEGWDVKNVVSMVGLRPFTAESKILPEQTLGRGLRRMFRGENYKEYVSVIGTEAFMTFIEDIKIEGVDLETTPMISGKPPTKVPLLIELDKTKNIANLDFNLPKFRDWISKDYNYDIDKINLSLFKYDKLSIDNLDDGKPRVFKMNDWETEENVWETTVGNIGDSFNFNNYVRYIVEKIARKMIIISGKDKLFHKVYEFITKMLFGKDVDIKEVNMINNIIDKSVANLVINLFIDEINKLVIKEEITSQLTGEIKISESKSYIVNDTDLKIHSSKSPFNYVICDSRFEMEISQRLDSWSDVKKFTRITKNTYFKIPYINYNGEASYYYPDFIVEDIKNNTYIIETKGLEDLDVLKKWDSLVRWCRDANSVDNMNNFKAIFVSQSKYEPVKDNIYNFAKLVNMFINDKPANRI